LAIAAPIPREPPVTRAILPSSFMGIVIHLFGARFTDPCSISMTQRVTFSTIDRPFAASCL
jgi:hypothetical protein